MTQRIAIRTTLTVTGYPDADGVLLPPYALDLSFDETNAQEGAGNGDHGSWRRDVQALVERAIVDLRRAVEAAATVTELSADDRPAGIEEHLGRFGD